MVRIKSIMISVGDKIILQELDKDFLKENPKMNEILGKKVTIQTLYSDKDKDYDHIDGEEICKTCAYENIITFFIDENDWELELTKDNIDIPKTFKETDYKEICNELLQTLQCIVDAQSPKDMYDYALEQLEKYKQK